MMHGYSLEHAQFRDSITEEKYHCVLSIYNGLVLLKDVGELRTSIIPAAASKRLLEYRAEPLYIQKYNLPGIDLSAYLNIASCDFAHQLQISKSMKRQISLAPNLKMM